MRTDQTTFRNSFYVVSYRRSVSDSERDQWLIGFNTPLSCLCTEKQPIWALEASVPTVHCSLLRDSANTGGLTMRFSGHYTALLCWSLKTNCKGSAFRVILFYGATILATPERNIYSRYKVRRRTSFGRFLWKTAATRSLPRLFLEILVCHGQSHVPGNRLSSKKKWRFLNFSVI